jgi:hypothetical protein
MVTRFPGLFVTSLYMIGIIENYTTYTRLRMVQNGVARRIMSYLSDMWN